MSTGPDRPLNRRERQASARTLRAGLALAGIGVGDLQAACATLDSDTLTLQRFLDVLDLDNDAPLTAHQHDVIAQALNDHCLDQGNDHPARPSWELDG